MREVRRKLQGIVKSILIGLAERKLTNQSYTDKRMHWSGMKNLRMRSEVSLQMWMLGCCPGLGSTVSNTGSGRSGLEITGNFEF